MPRSTLSDAAPNDTARLEQKRRQALQGDLLAGVLLRCREGLLPDQGELLREWQRRASSQAMSGQGQGARPWSRKSTELWRNRGFNTPIRAPANFSRQRRTRSADT